MAKLNYISTIHIYIIVVDNANPMSIDSAVVDNLCLTAQIDEPDKSNNYNVNKNRSNTSDNSNNNNNILCSSLPYKSTNNICLCESQSESNRIKCLVDAYRRLLAHRAILMTEYQYQQLLNTQELKKIQLLNIKVETLTEELAETQIFYTFIRQYIKKHPRFLEWGPAIAEIKLKSDFYSST